MPSHRNAPAREVLSRRHISFVGFMPPTPPPPTNNSRRKNFKCAHKPEIIRSNPTGGRVFMQCFYFAGKKLLIPKIVNVILLAKKSNVNRDEDDTCMYTGSRLQVQLQRTSR